jgi:thioredoxin 1
MMARPLAKSGQAAPALPAMTDGDFDVGLESRNGPVLVAFIAHSCPPCHRTLEHLDQGKPRYADRLAMLQVDVTQNPGLQRRFSVTHTPTLLIFDRGKVVGFRRVGAATRERLFAWIDATMVANRTGA